jgi:hypothetical protein
MNPNNCKHDSKKKNILGVEVRKEIENSLDVVKKVVLKII